MLQLRAIDFTNFCAIRARCETADHRGGFVDRAFHRRGAIASVHVSGSERADWQSLSWMLRKQEMLR
jgi:hypothetical protein